MLLCDSNETIQHFSHNFLPIAAVTTSFPINIRKSVTLSTTATLTKEIFIFHINSWGGLDRRLRECRNVTSKSHIRGTPQKYPFQVCSQTSELHLNA